MIKAKNRKHLSYVTIDLRHIKTPKNNSSSASTVQLAKTKAISHLLTYAHATLKLGNSSSITKRRTLKRSELSISYRLFYLMNLKTQKEKLLILKYDYVKLNPRMEGHCIVRVLSRCFSLPRCINGDWHVAGVRHW